MGGRGGSGGGGESAVSAKMPALTGSEKQVSWATDIRESALLAADANVRNAQRHKRNGGDPDEYNPSVESAKEVRSAMIKSFQGQTSAKAFIDNRVNFTQRQLVQRAVAIDYQKGRR